jgi:hypothetical protein
MIVTYGIQERIGNIKSIAIIGELCFDSVCHGVDDDKAFRFVAGIPPSITVFIQNVKKGF